MYINILYLYLFQKYFFYLFLHLLASGDPDGGDDCHGHQPDQAGTNEAEHLKECGEEAVEEQDHVEEDEGDEARVQGDKLYMLI